MRPISPVKNRYEMAEDYILGWFNSTKDDTPLTKPELRDLLIGMLNTLEGLQVTSTTPLEKQS